MKISLFLGCLLFLIGCSYVDDSTVMHQDIVSIDSFFASSHSGVTNMDSGISSPETLIRTNNSVTPKSSQTPQKNSTTQDLEQISISTSDIISTGSLQEDLLLESTSDKDVEKLIDSLFESVSD